METVKGMSESPFSKDKGNTQLLEDPENAGAVIEQIKTKKKNKRNKQKAQLNGKENALSAKNGNNIHKEVLNPHHIENNGNGNDNDNGIDIKNDDSKESADVKENDSSSNMPESVNDELYEIVVEEVTDTLHEEFIIEETTSNEEATNQADLEDENNVENGNNCNSTLINETDDCAKNDILETEDQVSANGEGIGNGIEEHNHGEVNGVSVSSTQDQEIAEENCSMEDMLESSINDSNSESCFKDLDTTKESVQGTTDAAAGDEHTFSNKISNFLGKWNSSLSPEQKQDFEISSSKKLNESFASREAVPSHPYLSKVSGRPGIRSSLSSSTFSLGPKNDDMKTPKSSELVLDDSFRVRTDPSRLNPSEFQENPTLRKYKGKRCLNTNDDPTDGDDIFSSTTKKRKVEDKTTESGFLGNIFWSPFKKKSVDGEESLKLTTTESKLSRFLSPFWFWKKTAACQKGQ